MFYRNHCLNCNRKFVSLVAKPGIVKLTNVKRFECKLLKRDSVFAGLTHSMCEFCYKPSAQLLENQEQYLLNV